jgi:hypothetical protein
MACSGTTLLYFNCITKISLYGRLIVNDELERIWKETVVTYFSVGILLTFVWRNRRKGRECSVRTAGLQPNFEPYVYDLKVTNSRCVVLRETDSDSK